VKREKEKVKKEGEKPECRRALCDSRSASVGADSNSVDESDRPLQSSATVSYRTFSARIDRLETLKIMKREEHREPASKKGKVKSGPEKEFSNGTKTRVIFNLGTSI